MNEKDVKERNEDFLDVLLEFEGNGKDEPSELSDHQINIFFHTSKPYFLIFFFFKIIGPVCLRSLLLFWPF